MAACRFSATVVSFNSRAFSIATASWSANVSMSAMVGLSNPPGSERDIESTPMDSPCRTIGAAIRVRRFSGSGTFGSANIVSA